MMKSKALPVLAALALFTPGVAHAGAIEKGTFAIGAERITGMFHSDEKIEGGNNQGTTAIALLGNTADSPFAAAWQFPRIGLDGFIIDGLSLGGSFTVIHREPENSSTTDILVAPRVGFGFMFSRVVGIWPRGGISYWHESVSPDQGNADGDAHAFAFDVDVPLLIAPVRNFAITIGPVLDVSFDGRASGNILGANVSRDISFVQFGLSAGIVGLL
jgi:hypothetical protein